MPTAGSLPTALMALRASSLSAALVGEASLVKSYAARSSVSYKTHIQAVTTTRLARLTQVYLPQR